MGHDDGLFTIKLYHTYRQANLGTSVEGNNDNTSGVGIEAFFFFFFSPYFLPHKRTSADRPTSHLLSSLFLSLFCSMYPRIQRSIHAHSLAHPPAFSPLIMPTHPAPARTHAWVAKAIAHHHLISHGRMRARSRSRRLFFSFLLLSLFFPLA